MKEKYKPMNLDELKLATDVLSDLVANIEDILVSESIDIAKVALDESEEMIIDFKVAAKSNSNNGSIDSNKINQPDLESACTIFIEDTRFRLFLSTVNQEVEIEMPQRQPCRLLLDDQSYELKPSSNRHNMIIVGLTFGDALDVADRYSTIGSGARLSEEA